MDHSEHPRLLPDEMTDAVLTGATIYGRGDETVGTVSHVHGSGGNAQVVIDVGGFLGIGSKPVLVAVSDLDMMRDEDGVVHGVTRWATEDLKALPEHRD